MISRIIKKTVDLSKIQKVDQLEGPLYQLENGGHTFEITCLMDGAAAAVSGTVSARFLRADEETVYFTGTLTGNVVSITLPQSCYVSNGRFGLVVFVSGNDITSAVYAVAGSVYRSTSDHIIDPTEEIPSLEDLIAKIGECEDATAAANTAAGTANAAAAAAVGNFAPDYANLTFPVGVGTHCTHGGNYYVANTQIDSSEAWTAAHWTQVTAGAEISNLKSEIETVQEIVGAHNTPVISNGNMYLASGNSFTTTSSSTTRVVSGPIYLKSGETVGVTASGFGKYAYTLSTNGTTISSVGGPTTGTSFEHTFTGPVYFRLWFANADDSAISPADITVNFDFSNNIKKIENSLTDMLVPYSVGNGYMNKTGYVYTDSGTGKLSKYTVPSGASKIYLSGTSNMDVVTDNWCVLWFVANNAMIADGYVAVTQKPQTWTNYAIDIPSGTEEIWAYSPMTIKPSLQMSGNIAQRIVALENRESGGNVGFFEGAFTWTKRVFGLRMLADAQGCYFIPFNALGQGVSRGNGTDGNDYYIDNIHPTQLGAYNLGLGVWSYLRHIPCWYESVPGTASQPLDGTQWSGKSWYAYGTSLTAGTTSTNKYADFVANISGLVLTNKGYGGGALVSNRQIYNRLLDMTDGKLDADLITIEVGANDSGPLGNPWSLDTNEFYGALNHCIREMFAAGVKAQIVIMASYPSRYAAGDSTNKYDVDRLLNT